MKKLFTLTVAALVLFASACKKDDDKKEENSENTWTLDGTKYTVKYSLKDLTEASDPTTLLIFWDVVPTGTDSRVNSFNVSFQKEPTASGTYKLVRTGSSEADNELEIFAGSGTIAEAETGYAYLGETIDVAVVVEGGKIKITVPEITLKGTIEDGDVKVSASVKEL